MNRPWFLDGLSPDEVTIVDNLIPISSKSWYGSDEAAALRIADMPFMETIDGVDAAAMGSLNILLHESEEGYLDQVLSHPTLAAGITDDHTVAVAALRTVVRYRPHLLDIILDPNLVSVERRHVQLPHSGDISLSVLNLTPGTHRSMDILEELVRAQEGFMGVPLPTSYIGLVVTNFLGGGGGGPSGVFWVHAVGSEDVKLIAHELAHTYWPFFPSWIAEGGADFMAAISADARFPVRSCSIARNLSEWDRRYSEYIERGVSTSTLYACSYGLGRELFLDLYDSLGDQVFREGFGRLYVALRNGKYDNRCSGLERGVCYVRMSFVDEASQESGAIADEVIDRHYYGP